MFGRVSMVRYTRRSLRTNVRVPETDDLRPIPRGRVWCARHGGGRRNNLFARHAMVEIIQLITKTRLRRNEHPTVAPVENRIVISRLFFLFFLFFRCSYSITYYNTRPSRNGYEPPREP